MRTGTTTGSLLGRLTPAGTDTVYAELQEAIPQLWSDIQQGSCVEAYTPACKGQDSDVDVVELCLLKLETAGKTLEAKNILPCAGVDPTPANIAAFGKCVKERELAGRTWRGTLAYCAIQVQRGTTGEKAPKSAAWRSSFETWKNMWLVFVQKTNDQITGPNDAEVERYRQQYSIRREQFIDSGGTTSAPDIDPSRLIPRWVLWVGGIAGGIWVYTKAKAMVG